MIKSALTYLTILLVAILCAVNSAATAQDIPHTSGTIEEKPLRVHLGPPCYMLLQPSLAVVRDRWAELQSQATDIQDSAQDQEDHGLDHSLLSDLFMPALLNDPPCGPGYNPNVEWIPASALPEMKSLIDRANHLLDSATPFRCNNGRCRILVLSLGAHAQPGRDIALCEVTVVQDAIGAPLNCETVAITDGPTLWIRVIRNSGLCFVSGRVTLAGFALDYNIDSKATPQRFLQLFAKRLAASRFRLKVDYSPDRNKVTAVAGMRISPILVGYRELVEIRLSAYYTVTIAEPIDLEERISKDRMSIGIEYEGYLFVSRQNPPNLADYRGPTEAERSRYIGALEEFTENLLNEECGEIQWQDSYSLSCKFESGEM
jgi:hypothetical protein